MIEYLEFLKTLGDMDLVLMRHSLKKTQPEDRAWLDAVEKELKLREKI